MNAHLLILLPLFIEHTVATRARALALLLALGPLARVHVPIGIRVGPWPVLLALLEGSTVLLPIGEGEVTLALHQVIAPSSSIHTATCKREDPLSVLLTIHLRTVINTADIAIAQMQLAEVLVDLLGM